MKLLRVVRPGVSMGLVMKSGGGQAFCTKNVEEMELDWKGAIYLEWFFWILYSEKRWN